MITRYPVGEMAIRIWRLRHTKTAHDATDIALTEVSGCSSITMDASLVSGCHQADVVVYSETGSGR